MLTDDTELNTAGTNTNYFNLTLAPNEAKEDTDETDKQHCQWSLNSVLLANIQIRLRKKVAKTDKTKTGFDSYTTKTTDVGQEELGVDVDGEKLKRILVTNQPIYTSNIKL